MGHRVAGAGASGAETAVGADAASLPPLRARPPGELLRIDSKTWACIKRTGHHVTGDPREHIRGVRYEAAFVPLYDRSRVAFAEMFADERKRSAATFLDHATHAIVGRRERVKDVRAAAVEEPLDAFGGHRIMR